MVGQMLDKTIFIKMLCLLRDCEWKESDTVRGKRGELGWRKNYDQLGTYKNL